MARLWKGGERECYDNWDYGIELVMCDCMSQEYTSGSGVIIIHMWNLDYSVLDFHSYRELFANVS